jgi:hypothetical protein
MVGRVTMILIDGFGNDTLTGGAGNDRLIGGADNDVLNGGSGIDTADFSSESAVNASLLSNSATMGERHRHSYRHRKPERQRVRRCPDGQWYRQRTYWKCRQ